MSRQYTSSSYQQSSKFTSESRGTERNVEGELADILGDRNAVLNWTRTEGDNVVISGGSDFSLLSGFRGALLSLRNDFFTGSDKITIAGDRRE